MHIYESKQNLRHSIELRLKSMSDLDRERESRSVCRRLAKLIPENCAVCAYSAFKKTEPDLSILINDLLGRGNEVYFPFFEADNFIFRRAQSFDELKPGKLGILEPQADAKAAAASQIRIALVPGRAFDMKGNRLGRGNGGYDRWIATQRKINPDTKMWGIAFECQIVSEVPVDQHDQRMDGVVTARGLAY